MPVPWAANWIGAGTLWTRLPPTGVLPVQRALTGPLPWNSKFPWWRTAPGQLTIDAHPTGATAGFQARIPTGYPPTGFQSTDLAWASLGCWQITAHHNGNSLTITIWLQPLPGA